MRLCIFLTMTFLLFANRLVKSLGSFNCQSSCSTDDVNPVCASCCRGHQVRIVYSSGRCKDWVGCAKNVRVSFNKKVINSLKRQFVAYMGKVSSVGLQGIQVTFGIKNHHILMWKFNQLDSNANYLLERKELHSFLRATKRRIIYRKCSKTFVDYCDGNKDERLSRSEWYACFGIKEIKRCIGEYLSAVKSLQVFSSRDHFIPRCQSDGSYAPTQCHSTIGYCWCVDVNTGKLIPDSTQKTNSLDCRKYATRGLRWSSEATKGVKKECTRDIFPVFAHQLIQVFRKELAAIRNGAMPGQLNVSMIRTQRKARPGNLGERAKLLSDYQILTWKFSQLDTNRNRLLTTSEYFTKAMKKNLGRVKRGRRCSRKVLSECDFDKTGGLSLDEWRYCILMK